MKRLLTLLSLCLFSLGMLTACARHYEGGVLNGHYELRRPEDPASFLYALPLGDGQVLLEETCLAAAPGVPIDTLKVRLGRRLERRGVDPAAIATPLGREVVRIPMLGRGAPPPPGVVAIGTAGRGGHPASGYSVAHALASAPRLASAIAAGRTPVPDPTRAGDHVRSLALRALLRGR